MSSERFLRSVRILAQCYQAFERLSGRHVRELGLTAPQFDIVATLGRLPGLSFRELGERTLITKGTLTGVVARLEKRGIVERAPNPADGRSLLVRLTPVGEQLFERVFPLHVAHCRRAFAGWTPSDFDALDRQLLALRAALESGPGAHTAHHGAVEGASNDG
jgi:DNA-binding MarR family transcriptional regulator